MAKPLREDAIFWAGRRITRRMILHKAENLEDYVRILEETPDEVEALYQDVLINVTSFFRNPEAFEVLKTKVFPKITKDRSRHEPVRIWVLAAGPNEPGAFHVVGGQFDTVFREGAYDLRRGGSQSGGAQVLDLAPASGGFVELSFPQAGDYPFVTHIMSDAERGAHGVFRVR